MDFYHILFARTRCQNSCFFMDDYVWCKSSYFLYQKFFFRQVQYTIIRNVSKLGQKQLEWKQQAGCQAGPYQFATLITSKNPGFPPNFRGFQCNNYASREHTRFNRKMVGRLYRLQLQSGQDWSFKFYRGSLPNATFGPGKKSHKPNFALAIYLANAFFGHSCLLWTQKPHVY